jgi:hypothetical protein
MEMSIPIEDLILPAYLEAMRFTDGGPDNPELDEASIDPEAVEVARKHCHEFVARARPLLLEAVNRVGYDWTRVGHDFWFTRNRHGVGFWDRDQLDEGGLGRKLTEIADSAGQSESYLGENGRIFLTDPLFVGP